MLGSCWDHVRVILGSCRDRIGVFCCRLRLVISSAYRSGSWGLSTPSSTNCSRRTLAAARASGIPALVSCNGSDGIFRSGAYHPTTSAANVAHGPFQPWHCSLFHGHRLSWEQQAWLWRHPLGMGSAPQHCRLSSRGLRELR